MAVGMYTARHAVRVQVNIKYPKLSQKVPFLHQVQALS